VGFEEVGIWGKQVRMHACLLVNLISDENIEDDLELIRLIGLSKGGGM
jgi:hypothetical protein